MTPFLQNEGKYDSKFKLSNSCYLEEVTHPFEEQNYKVQCVSSSESLFEESNSIFFGRNEYFIRERVWLNNLYNILVSSLVPSLEVNVITLVGTKVTTLKY